MDPDAPPLVQADYFANQGEQLASRRAYQQAINAHNEAAKQYQIAAQATTDTTAAKALLLQRDRQIKLAAEVQRRLTSGNRSGPMSTRTTTDRTAQGSSAATRQPTGGEQSKRTSAYAVPHPAAGRNGLSGASQYAPRDRIEASAMAESRYSRNSGGSPSASQITAAATPSSGDSGRASSVEESYYLLRSDSDPGDPVNTFLALVDNMVEELGNAVAFASVPLDGDKLPIPTLANRKKSDAHPVAVGQKAVQTKETVQDSFYMVPQSGAAGRAAQANISSRSGSTGANSTKTHEELLAENVTLKETLDTLSKQLDWLQKERQKERDKMRGSVALLARDFRKQAERVMGQSVANLGESSRRQMPPLSAITHQPAAGQPQASLSDDSGRIASLQEELRQARADAERNAQLGQRYKSKYEDLRKQILDKRKAKEAATAASTGGGQQEPADSPSSTTEPPGPKTGGTG